MGPHEKINLFKNYSYSMRKKLLRNNYTKNINITVQRTQFPNL